MKKIFFSFLIVFTLFSCDDGDITLHSLDFSSQSVQECSDKFIIYKMKNNELILIQLPESTFETAFTNEITGDTPRTVTISSTNIVLYRIYSDDVSSSTICSDLPPATPTVINEWEANGGTIQIETNEILNTDSEVTGYTHNITLLNVNFSGSGDSFSFESYIFGDYKTDI